METNNLDKELQSIAEDLVEGLIRGLVDIGKGNSNLAKSIKYSISDYIITLDMDMYGVFLDSGTQPHMPPVDAIKEWADNKGLNAWGVAMNIKKYGTKPQPFLHSIDSIIKGMEKRIADAGFKDFVIDVDNIIEKNLKNVKIK